MIVNFFRDNILFDNYYIVQLKIKLKHCVILKKYYYIVAFL